MNFCDDPVKYSTDVSYQAQVKSDMITKFENDIGNYVDKVITPFSNNGFHCTLDKEGYGGDIQFTLGITNEGTTNGISILAISETPGLGMEAESVLKPQFEGKKAAQFNYTKTGAVSEDQIDAISGATITTNAVTNGVNAGLYYFQNVLGGGMADE